MVVGVEDIDTRSFDCRQSDANTKDAKGAASKASDTASGSLFYLFITQLFVRSWIVIMVIFGSERFLEFLWDLSIFSSREQKQQ